MQRPQGVALPGVATEPSTQVNRGAKRMGEGEVREGLRGLVGQWRDFGFYSSCRGSCCAYRIMPETVSELC